MIHANMAMKKYTDSGYETIYYTLFSLPCFAGFSKEKYINKYSLIAFLSFFYNISNNIYSQCAVPKKYGRWDWIAVQCETKLNYFPWSKFKEL